VWSPFNIITAFHERWLGATAEHSLTFDPVGKSSKFLFLRNYLTDGTQTVHG
jgi:hypothetical protein